MAEMIPESISGSDTATNGEKRVFQFLRDILTPDEDYIVWHEPRVLSRYPDFIIWSQQHGLLLLEVKDWSASNIRSMTPEQFEVIIDGKSERFKSPLRQVRDIAMGLLNDLKKVPSFVHHDGPNKQQMTFPVGYAVFWTNISKSQADSIRLAEVVPANLSFYADDLRLDTTSREEQRAISARIRQSFTTWYEFDPLSHASLKILRHMIFPEVRVRSVRLRNELDEVRLKTLDIQQEKTAKSIGSGHRILKGVAGSGKTLVLACRARIIKSVQVKWRVLIVCYGISLTRYIRQLVNTTGPGERELEIEVVHFHGLVKNLTGKNLRLLEKETSQAYDERIGQILLGSIAEGSVQRGQYDAILVDEGQDFHETWMQGLVLLLNEQSDSLLFCYDPAQNVFGRASNNWKRVGMKVQGKKPITLETNYRNTSEILEAARIFSDKPGAIATATGDEIDEPLIPTTIDRHGNYPHIMKCRDNEGMIKHILDTIDRYIRDGSCDWNEIGVLYIDRYWQGFTDAFPGAFASRFGPNRLYWVTDDRNSKLDLDLSTPSVKLLTIESCKGLEFRVIFLVGLDKMPRIKKPLAIERKMAYVGLTRAQDAIHVVHVMESDFIENLRRAIPTHT